MANIGVKYEQGGRCCSLWATTWSTFPGEALLHVNGDGIRTGALTTTVEALDELAVEWCKARGIIPGLTEDQIRHAQELEAKMMKIRSQDAPSPGEWEEVGEIEEELAEMFCNILPAKEGTCST